MNKDAENIIVSIQCLVYNHEPYLRQCLEGFVMQKTNFKFEAIVHDDVSTDGSAKIIAEYAAKYPDIIKPIYETENQYSKRDGSLERIMNEACRGKYIALCEGDDYWIDPLKLQKQVDFMDTHTEYSMCFANAIEHFEGISSKDNMFSVIEDRDYSGYEIYDSWIIPTASVLLKNLPAIHESYSEACNTYKFIYGDIVLFLSCALHGKIRGMSDVFSVYRRHDGGITKWSLKSKDLCVDICNHQLYVSNFFGKEFERIAIKKYCRCCIGFFEYYLSHKDISGAYLFFSMSLKVSFLETFKLIMSEVKLKVKNIIK